MFSCSAPGSTYLPLARPLLLSLYVLATLMQLPLDGSMTNFILCQLFLDWLYALFTLYMKLLCSRSVVTKLCVCVCNEQLNHPEYFPTSFVFVCAVGSSVAGDWKRSSQPVPAA